MGDWRYYTYYQFFGIIILVMFSMFVLGSMVIWYYRNSEHKNGNQMSFIFFLLSVLFTVKIVEFVIPQGFVGLLLRSFISIFLIGLILKWLVYLNTNVFKVIKFQSKKVIEIICGVLIILTLITNGKFFIVKYNFFKTYFSMAYIFVWSMLFILVFLFILGIFVSKHKIHRIYSNKSSALLLIIFMLLPVGLYSIMLILKLRYLDFAEIFIFSMLAIFFNIIMYSQSPSGITVLTFNKIGDIINDYVFVTDMKGRVIYKNSRVHQSPFFVKDEMIDLEKIETFYQPTATKLYNPKGDVYIKIKEGESEYYFIHRCDALKDKNENIGFIITIADISELMELLHLLKEMKEKAKDANEKLKNYAEVVYNIEKEKEINMLLEKILSSREKDMKKLVKYIEELIQNEVEEKQGDFTEEIDFMIQFNQKILEEVRKTVNAYR